MVAIIKYYTNSLGMVNATFEEVSDPRKKGKILSKDEAKARIKELGLVKVYRDENGVIWDTPDKEFLTAFEGIGDEIEEIG
jgi:hypothetical protein